MLKMKGKLEKYFYNILEILLVALILDPRLKLDGLEEILTIYFDALILVKDDNSLNS